MLRPRRPSGRGLVVTALALIVAWVSAGAPAAAQEPAGEAADGQQAERARVASRSLSAFGLDLFRELSSSNEGPNTVFSPLSAGLAFALLQEGAEGETRAELRAALRLDSGRVETFREGVPALVRQLTSDTSVVVRIGTSLWVRADRRLASRFRSRGEEVFDARVEAVDFQAQADLDRINAWAEEQTEGKIPTVIQPPVREDLVLLLLNAVYFKGLWVVPFDTTATRPEPFARADGDTVEVPMMRRTGDYGYAELDGVRGVRLPYRGGRFRAYVLLPDTSSSVAELTRRLSYDTLASWAKRFRSRRVALRMPSFEHRGSWGLKEPLRALGVRRALSPDSAQLEAIWAPEDRGPPRRSFTSRASQSTYLRFDEEGTEAAAVTSVGITVTGVVEPTPFVVDRPFLLIVRNDSTGAVPFVAEIGDPTSEGGP